MPRKHKNSRKHKRYVKPDYHSQNKRDDNTISNKKRKKNKLRTSYDVYKRLIHDPNIGIDLNYISIGYEGTEEMEEMPVPHWKMIDDGGDIPMHRIEYFVLYLLDGEKIIIWDKKTKLDRLFCSGETNKNTQSLRSLLLHDINPHNIPKSKRPESHENDDEFDSKEEDEGKQYDDPDMNNNNRMISSLPANPTIIILDQLISIFDTAPDFNEYKITFSYNKNRVIQEPQLHTGLKRSDYKLIANKTKQIMENGSFKHPKTNKTINIKSEMDFSLENTELYLESLAFPYLDITKHQLRKYPTMEIEITHETTLDCAYRLTAEYGTDIKMAMLNFSSARNPGGGWDSGAKAQEESIARSSTLIPTLLKYESEFYEYHKKQKKTMLYSHALIYSPDIVIMKHGNGQFIERDDGYYKCNIITSPAVNACYVKRAKVNEHMMKKYGGLQTKDKNEVNETERKQAAWNVIEVVMKERCKRVLELAMKYENEYLILGAWGCGVFGNDVNMIARIFAELLKDRYHNVFRKVVFAILNDRKKNTIDKFIYEFDKVFNRNKGIKCNNNHDMNQNDDPMGKTQYKQYNFI